MKILTRKGQRPSTDTVKKYDVNLASNAGIVAGFASLPSEIFSKSQQLEPRLTSGLLASLRP